MNALPAGRRFNFRPVAGQPFHEAWRAIDLAVARWVLAHGGGTMLAEVAAWASYAEGQGDSALPLRGDRAGRHGMAILDDHDLDALAAEPMVAVPGPSTPAISTPFVFDDGHFYLRRNYLHEVAVAQLIRQRRESAVTPVSAVDDADLRVLFNGLWLDSEAPQRAAVRHAPGKRLFVLTGGPGTGKTTTVLRMLLALARDHAARHDGRMPVIRTCAPTGKAAQRLTESLRSGGIAMGEKPSHMPLSEHWQPLDRAWQPFLDATLAAESGTLHRLLGSRGRHGGFSHHAGNPLTADIVVVDEASMVDLAMLRALLDALRPDAVLVLVGDADQLTSVGTGSILLDLVGAMEGADAQDTVRLHHSFRADTTLVPINDAIRQGDMPAFEQAWRAAGERRAIRREAGNTIALKHLLSSWCKALRANLDAVGAFSAVATDDHEAVGRVLLALRQQQLLCALREGEFGAEQANFLMEAAFRSHPDGASEADWYPGRSVMITRNDSATGLFNGDVGICLRHPDGNGGSQLKVWFDATQATAAPGSSEGGAARLRSFAPGGLPSHRGAFAMTIHKSQGSEYGSVAVLLPPATESRVLSRQLLYTAVSRARLAVSLWGGEDVVRGCIETAIHRSGTLASRLA